MALFGKDKENKEEEKKEDNPQDHKDIELHEHKSPDGQDHGVHNLHEAQLRIANLEMELKNKTSWFNKNGCYKVLVIFTVISIIFFGVGMFILGR